MQRHRYASIFILAVGALGAAGCAEESISPQLGSSAEELTATVTFQSGSAVTDTFISASDMKQNNGSDKKLRISAQNEGLVRFDLASIPANAVINQAVLTFDIAGGEEERDDDCRDGDHEGYAIAPLKLHRVTAAWAEGTVTYKSFDQAFDSAVAATMVLTSRHTYKTLDLKPLVQSWVNGSKPNYGVLVNTAGRAHTLIVSSEGKAGDGPTLKVTYTTPDDHCTPNQCQHGSTCSNNSNGYTCQCTPGYSGHDCQIDINECAGNPCRHGGQCTDQVNGYTCSCTDGWGGANCETNVDECDANPCQNGGVCTEVEQQACGGHGWRHRGHNSGFHHGHHGGGGNDDDDDPAYTCACPPGFTGLNCEVNINDCAGNPCGANGTCNDGANGYTCTCAAGYGGDTCQTNLDDCVGNACANGSTCVDGVGSYTCSCPAGFEGPLCATNIQDCTATTCQNGGTCTDQVNGYTCSCPAGFTGTNCEIDINECATNPCQNGGTCTDLANAYACQCAAGYDGANCEINVDECAGSPCQNGGTCIDGINSYTCTCAAGFAGQTCADDINECASVPCAHGTCTDRVNGYTCGCDAGWTGANCNVNIDDCAANPCQNGGTCTDGINSFTCACANGYAGATCQTPPIVCPTGASGFGTHCYQASPRFIPSADQSFNYWMAAEADCANRFPGALQGHLASIHSAAENTFVRGLSTDGLMLAGTDFGQPANSFAWLDSSLFDFPAVLFQLPWNPGQPDNRNVPRFTPTNFVPEDWIVMLQDGHWYDAPYTDGVSYVCKFLPPPPPSCPAGWSAHGGYCYNADGPPANGGNAWAFGEAQCQVLASGAHLASIHSSEENDYVRSLAPPSGPTAGLMIGLTQGATSPGYDRDANTSAPYAWSDDSHVEDYSGTHGGIWGDWNSGEPNNRQSNGRGWEDCAKMVENGGWIDVPCTDATRYVCKLTP